MTVLFLNQEDSSLTTQSKLILSTGLPQFTTDNSKALKPNTQSSTSSTEELTSKSSSSPPMTLEQQQTLLKELGVSIVEEDSTRDEVVSDSDTVATVTCSDWWYSHTVHSSIL